MEVDHLPNRKPPKPVRAPLPSPEINAQLNVTPEKNGYFEQYVRREVREVPRNKNCYNGVVARDNILSQPQMNTTARLTQKIKKLNETEFDTPSLIQRELKKSEKLRQEIAEKASEALNYNPKESTYPGLVSLDISASDLALQQRKIFKEKTIHENKAEPDIMSFMSDDLEHESASLACDCKFQSIEPELCSQPTEEVFKLYEIMECWKR